MNTSERLYPAAHNRAHVSGAIRQRPQRGAVPDGHSLPRPSIGTGDIEAR